jgi:hypothetical protein
MSHQLAAFVKTVCLPIVALVLLAACSAGEVVTPLTQVVTTETTATARLLASATPPSTATVAPSPKPIPELGPLVGPLALLIVEKPQTLEMHAVIYDFGANTVRDLPLPESRSSAARWLGDGCELYVGGTIYDVQGAAVWEAPQAVRQAQGGLYVERLSPGKRWLAAPVFSGAQTYDSTEFVDVEAVSLTPPYATYRLSQRGGAEAGAFVWSPDEQWVYFSDYDANGILQIMRATPDGQIQEQLTQHEWVLGQVNSLAISPDGQRLAYGVRQALPAGYPYEYAEADEGWIGIIDVDGDSVTRIRLPKFDGVFDGRGLWWNAAGNELLIVGHNLPIPNPDPVAGTQIHWVRINEGGIPYRSAYDAEAPEGPMGWVMPVSADLNTLFLNTRKGSYLLEDGEFSPHPAAELFEAIESGGRIIDVRIISTRSRSTLA